MDRPEKSSTIHGTDGAVTGMFSSTGPETPPDIDPDSPLQKPAGPIPRQTTPAQPPVDAVPVAGSAPPPTAGQPLVDPLPWPNFGDEPTQHLPFVKSTTAGRPPPLRFPPVPASSATPPVEARAVIVYTPEPRRSWGLLVLTAILVALTTGVVLGQTVANQPRSRSASAALAQPVPSYSTPAEAAVSPPDQSSRPAGQLVSAPLGSAKTRRIEVTGGSTTLKVRTADLGTLLYRINTLDASAIPQIADTEMGSRLELIRTGAPGVIGAEIQLNAAVNWTIVLTGGSAEQDLDLRAGGLTRLELAGGAARAVLRLPGPKGTVGVSVTGTVNELTISADKGAPVRVRLGKGAATAILDGTARRKVTAGTALTSTGWGSARNRYDVTTTAQIDTVRVN
jgi:hypothetical protein